jgi:hypothetical protein
MCRRRGRIHARRRRVDVVAHHLSGIVDADDLSRIGAGEVDIAHGAAIVRKAAPYARQVLVDSDDHTSRVDARRKAVGRARDSKDLINPAREGERGHGRGGAVGIEGKPADRGGALTVENRRLRCARIVDTRERVRLRYSQPSSYGFVVGDNGAFEPKTGSKIQQTLQKGPSRSVRRCCLVHLVPL